MPQVLQEVPPSGGVIEIGDLAGPHPDDTIAQMLADPLHHLCERRPADALRRVQPLPVRVPDTVGRPGLDTTHNDAGLAVLRNIVVGVNSLRVVLPDAEVVPRVGHQVVDAIRPIARLAVNGVIALAGIEEARDGAPAELAFLGQIEQGLPHGGVRLAMAACPQLGVPPRAGVATAARPGQSREPHAGALPLRKNAREVLLVLLHGDCRLVQPQTLVDGAVFLATGIEIEQAFVRHQLHVRANATFPSSRYLLKERLFLFVRVAGHAAPAHAEDGAGFTGNALLGAVVEEDLERLGPGYARTRVVAVERQDHLAVSPLAVTFRTDPA